jgi:protein kinase C substrate 80K-H
LRAAKEAVEAPEKKALDFYRQLEEEEMRKKTELEQLARDVEAEEIFAVLDVNNDGVIILQELQVRLGLDTDKDGVVSVEEAQFFMSGNEEFDLETFKQVAFPLMKPYLDLELEAEATGDEPADLTGEDGGEAPDLVHSPESEQPEVYDPWRQNQQEAETETAEGQEDLDEDDEGADEEEEDDYDVHDLPDQYNEDPEMTPPTPAIHQTDRYDEKTRNLIAAADQARKEFEEVERKLRDLDRDIGKLKEDIEKDYGPDGEFLVLAGQCFEYTENQYVYKMCPFAECTQRDKSGGSETRLGTWGSWEGSNLSRYSKLKFSNGQGCWNGPSRSALVHVHCGTDNVLSHVTEPNRCEYEMHFQTPAACQKPAPGLHDEL